MSDPFLTYSSGLQSPARGASEITPSDTSDLEVFPRAVYIGTAGNLRVTMIDGQIITLVNLAVGVAHPLRVKRIWATGTTATNIDIFW